MFGGNNPGNMYGGGNLNYGGYGGNFVNPGMAGIVNPSMYGNPNNNMGYGRK